MIKNKFGELKNRKFVFAAIIFISMIFGITGCYSVFSGGASGTVVDSSTVVKAGIPGVDVYCYTSKSDRDKDAKAWMNRNSEITFVPSAKYYGHTVTGSDGSFTISRMMWKAWFPDFGKDADCTTLYLLYYHKDYGIKSGSAIVLSDSVTDSIYDELTPLNKSVTLNLSFRDVATESLCSTPLRVKVVVPQSGYRQCNNNFAVSDSVYGQEKEIVITGSGSVTVSYPKWTDSTKTVINEPVIKIYYWQPEYQDADGDGFVDVDWMACNNQRTASVDYSFKGSAAVDSPVTIEKSSATDFKISSAYTDRASVNLYGKKTCMNANISGHVKNTANPSANTDGKKVEVESEILSAASTHTRFVGDNADSGYFTGISAVWHDYTYTDKITTNTVTVKVDGGTPTTKELSSNQEDYNFYIGL